MSYPLDEGSHRMVEREQSHRARWQADGGRWAPRFAALAGAGLLALAVARSTNPLAAQRAAPTFATDVAPILYKNCTTCHRPDGLGPFSLLDYEGAKTNANDIRDAIGSGYMPPWHAEGPHGVF